MRGVQKHEGVRVMYASNGKGRKGRFIRESEQPRRGRKEMGHTAIEEKMRNPHYTVPCQVKSSQAAAPRPIILWRGLMDIIIKVEMDARRTSVGERRRLDTAVANGLHRSFGGIVWGVVHLRDSRARLVPGNLGEVRQ